MILNQIAFDMEVVISFEVFWLEVFRNKLQGGSQIYGECPLRIRCRDEDHRPAGRMYAFEQS